jgi:mannose-1-phosphate guanylyltransferase/mannose-6-phosphate isomerase
LPDISVDYAVMEKAERVAIVPARFDWNDIGSWNSIAELIPADAQGNRIEGDAVTHNVTNTYLRGGHATPTVARPWGTYTVLLEGPRFKIKRIEVKPRQALSLQMHHHRSEHWIVVSGTARVTNDDRTFLVSANESTYIPIGGTHRLENPGVVDLVMIEVQCGDYLGEDDIVAIPASDGHWLLATVNLELLVDPARCHLFILARVSRRFHPASWRARYTGLHEPQEV